MDDKMTEHQKTVSMLKEIGIDLADVAKITGHTYGSVRVLFQPTKEKPKWVRLTLYVWEKMRSKRDQWLIRRVDPETTDTHEGKLIDTQGLYYLVMPNGGTKIEKWRKSESYLV